MNILSFFLLNRRSRCVLLSSQSILRIYCRWGESNRAIQSIETEVDQLLTHFQLASIVPDYLNQIKDAELNRQHKVIRLHRLFALKVALHIIPSGFKIPAHIHPDKINIIANLYGELRVKQCSLSTFQDVFLCSLKKQQSCAGLLNYRNVHSIEALDKPCVFISFRLVKRWALLSHYVDKITAIVVTGFLASLLGTTLLADSKNVSKMYQAQSIKINTKLYLANNYRMGRGVPKDYYEAVQLYQQEAQSGNAEAQYWLGVMYFDGTGITEDSDEALRWIALSADQKYPPAQKLLHHLLTTEEIPDC